MCVCVCVCVVVLELPERQEACFKQDGSQSPLDLLVVNQLGCFQTRVVGGETEAGVQHLVHPGRLEALIPGIDRSRRTSQTGREGGHGREETANISRLHRLSPTCCHLQAK